MATKKDRCVKAGCGEVQESALHMTDHKNEVIRLSSHKFISRFSEEGRGILILRVIEAYVTPDYTQEEKDKIFAEIKARLNGFVYNYDHGIK